MGAGESLGEMAGRLRRNEEAMDAGQRERYARPLGRLRREIREAVAEEARRFAVIGAPLAGLPDGDREAARAAVYAAVAEGGEGAAAARRAADRLLETGDVGAMYAELYPLRVKVERAYRAALEGRGGKGDAGREQG